MSFKSIGNLTHTVSSAVGLRPESESSDRIALAKQHAFVMLSAYRKIDCDDPEAWTTATVAVLALYPADVMAEICHPQSGIQTRIKWPPTAQEIREAGDIALDRKLARERREKLRKHRVLLDTPYGPRPEPEAAPMLEAERQRIIAGFEQLKRDLQANKGASEKPRSDRPPPGLDAEGERQWYERRLETLKAQPKHEYKLSPAAKATNAGRDWGAPDITYGPAPKHQEAAE